MFVILRRFRTVTVRYEITRASHGFSRLQPSLLPQEDKLDGVPHFDVEITDENIDNVTKTIIRNIKSSWDVNRLEKTEFKGGLSNKIIGYLPSPKRRWPWLNRYEKPNLSDMLLVRIFGEKTDIVKDHEREVRNIDELSKNNITPPLYCTFLNGYCSEFVEGTVCTPEDLKDKDILRLTSSCMADLHTAELSEDYLRSYKFESTLFQNIGYYFNAIPTSYDCVELRKQLENGLDSLEQLSDEIAFMSDVISSLENLTVSYCHNDYHPINLIHNKKKGTMHVIDHERGCPNFSSYDIGNFFNEFAGIRNMNYGLYPTKETQFWWLRLYLQKVNELNGCSDAVTNTDIAELREHVELMSLVSHLFWVTWALFRAGSPVAGDFDYMHYGITRFNEYCRRKEDVEKTIGIRY